MTALSDLEVEYKDVKGKLSYIKYPLKTHSDVTGQRIFLVVATTRPETMLGDTALAVHPEDKRYDHFIGQKAILPIVGRPIRIIADKMVDPEFGTGVMKVTPAHDPQDWQIAQKHKLRIIPVIGFDNKMTKNCGEEFSGLSAAEARKKIITKLNKANLLIKERSFTHSVGHCERCKTAVEPLVSKQWFINTNSKFKIKNAKLRKLLVVKTASLKHLGILAVKKRLIKILPKRFRKNYLRWMRNLDDWCVSRQLWWGHQLPIWYCGTNGLSDLQKSMNPELVSKFEIRNSKFERKGCGQIMIGLTKPKSCPRCKKRTTIIQDPDTFDCWFSSGQWAYTTLGYPNGHDYNYFYPTSVMETGYEILNIWVAKMIMLGLYRTCNIPFKTVYLHGLVRDAFGQKMSKSKGNVVNPLDVIGRHGADALRMALVIGPGAGNDVSVGEDKIRGYRNFTNKVWNIGRFIAGNFPKQHQKIPFFNQKLTGLTEEDRKITKKLDKLINQVTYNLDAFKFSSAATLIYQFLWHEFADKYIETVKDRVRNKDIASLAVLRHVYLNCLKLLHPFMPFITEACWQQMPRRQKEPLIKSCWPKT